MLVRLLRHRSIGLSPEAKFFLLRFLQEEQKDQKEQVDTLAALNVRKIAKRIGVTPKVAGAAIEQLVSLGLLTRQSKLRQLGRPSSEYRCSSAAVEKLLGPTKANPGQEARAAKLMDGASEQKGQRLLYANRLLLAVLVAQADAFGVVRELGWRDLAELTGLQREVIRRRLEWLLDQGYLRSVVPGATGVALFKKAKSEYFLNLAHPKVQVGNGPVVCVFRSNTITELNQAWEARQILDYVDICQAAIRRNPATERLNFGAPYLEHAWGALELFDELRSRRLEPVLQATVDALACWLLVEHRNKLSEEDFDNSQEIHDRLNGVFSYLRQGSGKKSINPSCVDSLVRMLGQAALSKALMLKDALDALPELAVKEAKYCMLPQPAEWVGLPVCWVLLYCSDSTESLPDCIVADMTKGAPQRFESESSLGLEERYRYGLLTKPKPKTGQKLKPEEAS